MQYFLRFGYALRQILDTIKLKSVLSYSLVRGVWLYNTYPNFRTDEEMREQLRLEKLAEDAREYQQRVLRNQRLQELLVGIAEVEALLKKGNLTPEAASMYFAQLGWIGIQEGFSSVAVRCLHKLDPAVFRGETGRQMVLEYPEQMAAAQAFVNHYNDLGLLNETESDEPGVVPDEFEDQPVQNRVYFPVSGPKMVQ